MANHMAEVAKILGVELGEEFEIDYGHNRIATAKFTNTRLHIINTNMLLFLEDLTRVTLDWLLGGVCTIKRKPWKPKDDEKYWCVEPDGKITGCCWLNIAGGNSNYKLGNCYRTREEAEANRDKWVAFYASDEVLEV